MDIIRISDICLMSFDDSFSVESQTKPLYIYKFSNGKELQLLNADDEMNDRNKSYSPFVRNTRLTTTPHFILGEDFHNSSEVQLPTKTQIEYCKASVNFAAGWFYSKNDRFSGVRLYFVVDGIYNVTVASLLDDKLSTRLKANKKNIVLEKTVFNTSWDIEYINLQWMLNSDNGAIKELVTSLFGPGKHQCSDLFIEQFIVQNDEVIEYEQQGWPYTRFYIASTNKGYKRNVEEDANLFCSAITNEKDTSIELQLLHTKYNTESYLSKMLTDYDEWSIEYEVSTIGYNVYGNSIGSMSISLRNPEDTYSGVTFRPVIPSTWIESTDVQTKVDHIVFDIRAIAKTCLTQLELVRYARITDTNPMQWYIGRPVFESPIMMKAYSKKEVVTHKVEVKQDLPNIMKIIQPYYVFSSTGSEISITPYDTSVAIDLSSLKIKNLGKLKIRFDGREYWQKSSQQGNVIFTIPGTEYLQSTKEWYIFDENDTLVTFGTIARVGKQ